MLRISKDIIPYFNNNRDWSDVGEDLFGVLLPGFPVDDPDVTLGIHGQVRALRLGQGRNERRPLDFPVGSVGSDHQNRHIGLVVPVMKTQTTTDYILP